MIVGAMKSGTTTIARMLEQHPNVVLCDRKEPDFFSKSKDWKAELDSYHALFQQKENVIYGEGSTSYTFYPHRNLEIWEDIYEYNPDVKIIYILRSPLSRTVSHYVHAYERGYFKDSIDDAVLNRPEIIDYSRYASQIEPFIERFGQDQVLILDFDDLKKAPTPLFSQVSEFLGIDFSLLPDPSTFKANEYTAGGGRVDHRLDGLISSPPKGLKKVWRLLPEGFRKQLFYVVSGQRKNALTVKPKMSVSVQKVVLQMLDKEITKCERLLAKDLSHWRRIED